MKKLRLSVIIPAYNEENTIKKTLKSVVKQKADFDFEIIVVDDSRDRTADIAEEFLSRYNFHYRVVRNRKRLGLARSVDKGVRLSNKKSDFVMVLHSDIALKNRDWLKKAMRHFEDERVVAVTGRYSMPSFDDLSIISKFCLLKYFRNSIREEGTYEISFIEDRCNVYRKKILLEHLFSPDFHMGGDQDSAYTLIGKGYKLIYDSSLVYEAFMSSHQNSYLKVLGHEMNWAMSQVAINIRHWGTIQKGTSDSNLKSRMMFRIIQLSNVAVTLVLLLLQKWELLGIVFLLRLAYSLDSYFKIHKDFIEVALFSLLDYFTDFAYFWGVLAGTMMLIFK